MLELSHHQNESLSVPSPSLAALASRINAEHRQASEALKSGLAHAKLAGEFLRETKAAVPHGQWQKWVNENCEFSGRTAQAYMRVAAQWESLNAQRVAHLSLRDGLELLAAHKAPADPPQRWSPEQWAQLVEKHPKLGELEYPLAPEREKDVLVQLRRLARPDLNAASYYYCDTVDGFAILVQRKDQPKYWQAAHFHPDKGYVDYDTRGVLGDAVFMSLEDPGFVPTSDWVAVEREAEDPWWWPWEKDRYNLIHPGEPYPNGSPQTTWMPLYDIEGQRICYDTPASR